MTRDKVKARFLMDKIGPIFPPHLSVVKVEVNLAARREGISSDGGCPLKTLLEYGWLRDHNSEPHLHTCFL
jgi:hypothetical protein